MLTRPLSLEDYQRIITKAREGDIEAAANIAELLYVGVDDFMTLTKKCYVDADDIILAAKVLLRRSERTWREKHDAVEQYFHEAAERANDAECEVEGYQIETSDAEDAQQYAESALEDAESRIEELENEVESLEDERRDNEGRIEELEDELVDAEERFADLNAAD